MNTPRERFVEAMRAMLPWIKVIESGPTGSILFSRQMRQAAEAFADVYCKAVDGGEHCEAFDCQDFRASILKEIGL